MTDGYTEDAAALAAAVLDEEAKRPEQAEREAGVVLPDDLLPGVGINRCRREAFAVGGKGMAVLLLLNLVDELLRTIRVLAPDIQRSLGYQTRSCLVSSVSAVLRLCLAPCRWLHSLTGSAESRHSIMSGFWAVATFLSGLVVNPFQLFWATAATGLGQAYRIRCRTR